jgi:hypothetical protein
MRPDERGAAGSLRSVADLGVKASIRAELEARFSWPIPLKPLSQPLENLGAAMDLGKLATLAASIHHQLEITFAIVSREYIRTGINWVNAMHRIGLRNFLIIAGDIATAHTFDTLGVPNVLAGIDESDFDPLFVSATGFTAKGLAVSAFKFPVTRFLLEAGYSVVMSDADAIWLRDPLPYLRGADVAFQRIVYHPPQITRHWGFAVCGGFLAFRVDQRTLTFLRRCIEVQRAVFCDQIAVNLATLEGDPDWQCEDPEWRLPQSGIAYDRSGLEEAFVRCAKSPISGVLQQDGVQLLALPHDKFWRHACVPVSVPETVICHPNSPKDDVEKMAILRGMNLEFEAP